MIVGPLFGVLAVVCNDCVTFCTIMVHDSLLVVFHVPTITGDAKKKMDGCIGFLCRQIGQGPDMFVRLLDPPLCESLGCLSSSRISISCHTRVVHPCLVSCV